MAIKFIRARIIGRSSGKSLAEAVAYIKRDGEEFNQQQKSDVVKNGIIAPEKVPTWMNDEQELVSRIEAAEKRQDSQTARELIVALPHEMSDDQHAELVSDYIRNEFTSQGMIAVYAIHRPDQAGDNRNHHAHILLTTREVTPEGFSTRKNREWNSKQKLEDWKLKWCELVNQKAERLKLRIRLDTQTHEELGLEATYHMGEQLTAMERKGIKTALGNHNREVEQRNQERRARPPEEITQLFNQEADWPEPLTPRFDQATQIKKYQQQPRIKVKNIVCFS